MIRSIPLIVGALLLIASLYLAWSYHRISARVLVHDEQWPRSWPYPDLWLAASLEELDRMFPASPGTFKIHGEVPRLQLILALSFAVVFSLGSLFAGPTIVSLAKHYGLTEKVRTACAFLVARLRRKKR